MDKSALETSKARRGDCAAYCRALLPAFLALVLNSCGSPGHGGRAPGGSVVLAVDEQHGMPLLPARINGGSQAWMVLDTGSQAFVLEDDTARDSGVTGASSASLIGISGVESARQGSIASLRLAGREFSSIPCVIRSRRTRLGGDALFGSKRIPLDLIGMSFLRAHFDWVTLDMRHGFVELGSGGMFQPKRSSGLWQAPLVFQGGLPFVRVGSRERSWLALVDTAAAAAAEVDHATATDLGLAPVSGQTRPRGGIGGAGSVPVVILPELAGLGPELTDVEALLVNDTPKIGTGLLRHFRVTLDFQRSALWLQR